jgi:hypothetical protein
MPERRSDSTHHLRQHTGAESARALPAAGRGGGGLLGLDCRRREVTHPALINWLDRRTQFRRADRGRRRGRSPPDALSASGGRLAQVARRRAKGLHTEEGNKSLAEARKLLDDAGVPISIPCCDWRPGGSDRRLRRTQGLRRNHHGHVRASVASPGLLLGSVMRGPLVAVLQEGKEVRLVLLLDVKQPSVRHRKAEPRARDRRQATPSNRSRVPSPRQTRGNLRSSQGRSGAASRRSR